MYLLLIAAAVLLLLINLYISKRDFINPAAAFCAVFLAAAVVSATGSKLFAVSIHLNTVLVIVAGMTVFTFVNFICSRLFKDALGEELVYDDLVPIPKHRGFSIFFIALEILMTYERYAYITALAKAVEDKPYTLSEKIGIYEYYTKFFPDQLEKVYTKDIPWLLYNGDTLERACIMILIYLFVHEIACGLKNKKLTVDPLKLIGIVFYSASIMLDGGRSTLFVTATMMIVLFYIWVIRRHINTKKGKIFIGAAAGLVVVFVLLGVALTKVIGRQLNMSVFEYLYVYIGAPMVNMDSYLNTAPVTHSSLIGEFTFTNLWNSNIAARISSARPLPLASILDFRISPNGHNMGNVYTMFYMFLYDFGYAGIVSCTLIPAVYYVLTYYCVLVKEKSKRVIDVWLLVFAYLYNALLMSFFSNRFYETAIKLYFVKVVIVIFVVDEIVFEQRILKWYKGNNGSGSSGGNGDRRRIPAGQDSEDGRDRRDSEDEDIKTDTDDDNNLKDRKNKRSRDGIKVRTAEKKREDDDSLDSEIIDGKKVSVKKNFLMNAILTASSVLFPLITFPYVSRVLTPVGTGRVSFAASTVSYFLMFAQLGIPTYGIREVAKVRNDKEKLSKTVSELLAINLVMSVISYIIFGGAILLVPKFRAEKTLLVLMSIQIILDSAGMEWLYKGMEQYTYIAVRSLIFKLIALILTFVLIKDVSDCVIYGGLTIFAASASNIINFFRAGRWVKLRPVKYPDMKKHLKNVGIFFAMAVATTLYTHIDILMLGFMSSDKVVGYYNAAVRIKVILVSLVTSLGVVLMPRASAFIKQGKLKEFRTMSGKAINFVFFATIPIVIYFMLFADEGIRAFAGDAYGGSVMPLCIIMPSILFIALTNIMGIQMLVPLGKEKAVLYSEIAGAAVNLVLNAIMIPFFGAPGAALATVIAEGIVWLVQARYLKAELKELYTGTNYAGIILAVVIGSVISMAARYIPDVFGNSLDSVLRILASAALFFGGYLVFLLLIKEKMATEILATVKNKVFGK